MKETGANPDGRSEAVSAGLDAYLEAEAAGASEERNPSSDASDFCFDRYPMTKSGCGRGREQFNTKACSHHS